MSLDKLRDALSVMRRLHTRLTRAGDTGSAALVDKSISLLVEAINEREKETAQ